MGAPEDELARLRRDLDEALQKIEHLRTALLTNRRIGIAVGILMVQRKVTDERAFALLVAASQTGNRKVRAVAEDVIYTGRLP